MSDGDHAQHFVPVPQLKPSVPPCRPPAREELRQEDSAEGRVRSEPDACRAGGNVAAKNVGERGDREHREDEHHDVHDRIAGAAGPHARYSAESTPISVSRGAPGCAWPSRLPYGSGRFPYEAEFVVVRMN